MCDRHTLLQSIATTAADYRAGEIDAITPEGVDSWVRQFEQFGFAEEHQLTILSELNRILGRFYINRERAMAFCQNMIKRQATFGVDLKAGVAGTKFLQIQRKGNSQNELLELLAEAVQQEYGLVLADCGDEPSRYIYVDDCIYSGNTIAHDLEDWFPRARERVPLTILTFGSHSIGVSRLYKVQRRFIQEKRIAVGFLSAKNLQLRNNPFRDGNVSDCYWPRELAGINDAADYVEELRRRREGEQYGPRLYRPNGNPYREEIFSSAEARDTIEYAFLKAGLYIMSLPQNANQHMHRWGMNT